MPRAVKPKIALGGHGGVVKRPAAKQKSKLYKMPEPIALGTVLTDVYKMQWIVGPSIGTGGFGEIYSASKMGENNYDYVVKCEPHGNGPLFVEMHFYMRNAKFEDIERYKRQKGLKKLGMPYMLGNGSIDIEGLKHRFIVLPRYGSNITTFFLKNGRRLPESTIYRLAIQMIDVLEYIHNCGYVHADLKGTNILLGQGKDGGSQAYLVDYGLASHYVNKVFKPDPKKMHNGTIEYTSRDAHQGVATMRSDLEILGYNLIEWSGVNLPWVRDNLLSSPAKVQQAKEAFMTDARSETEELFSKGAPGPLLEFIMYVATLSFNDTPNYEKCRKMFNTALKIMKCSNTGDLDLQIRAPLRNNDALVTSDKNKQKARTNKILPPLESSSTPDDEIIEASDDSEVFDKRKSPRVSPKATGKKHKPVQKASPKKPVVKHRLVSSPRKKRERLLSNAINMTDSSSSTSSPHNDAKSSKTKHQTDSPKITKSIYSPAAGLHKKLRSIPLSTTSNANLSLSGGGPAKSSKHGSTIINDNISRNSKSGKLYEFNFELDVSMDANVIVNVKRKKKTEAKTQNSSPSSSIKGNDLEDDSPATRVKMRKLIHTSVKGGTTGADKVSIKKTKKYVHSPR